MDVLLKRWHVTLFYIIGAMNMNDQIFPNTLRSKECCQISLENPAPEQNSWKISYLALATANKLKLAKIRSWKMQSTIGNIYKRYYEK